MAKLLVSIATYAYCAFVLAVYIAVMPIAVLHALFFDDDTPNRESKYAVGSQKTR